jgi:hypothetical protein
MFKSVECLCILVNTIVLKKLFGCLMTMKQTPIHFCLVVSNTNVLDIIKLHPLYDDFAERISFILLDETCKYNIDQILFSYREISKTYKHCLYFTSPFLLLNNKINGSFITEKIAFLKTDVLDEDNPNEYNKKLTNQILFVSDLEPLVFFKNYLEENIVSIQSKNMSIHDVFEKVSDEFGVKNHITNEYYVGCYDFFQGNKSITIDIFDTSNVTFFEINETIQIEQISSMMKTITNRIVNKYPHTMNYFLVNNMLINQPLQLKGIPNKTTKLGEIINNYKDNWYWTVRDTQTSYITLYNDVIFLELKNILDLDNSILGKKVYLIDYSEDILNVLDKNAIKYDFFSYIPDSIVDLNIFLMDNSCNNPIQDQVTTYDDVIKFKDISYNLYLNHLSKYTYVHLHMIDCAFISECIALGVIIVTKIDSLFDLEKGVHFIDDLSDDVNVFEIRGNLDAYYHQKLTEKSLLKRMFTLCIIDGEKIP